MKKDFVPVPVRAYLDLLLNGDEGHGGWLAHLDTVNACLAQHGYDELGTESKKQSKTARPSHGTTEIVRELQKMRDELMQRINCVRQLSVNASMADAYTLLSLELETEGQWRNFISAVISADRNYTAHRDAIKKVKQLASKISTKAEELAKLIADVETIDLDNTPPEFSSLRHLLYKVKSTNNPDAFEKWLKLRHILLGKNFRGAKASVDEYFFSDGPIGSDIGADQGNRLIRKMLNTGRLLGEIGDGLEGAWDSSPKVKTLLMTLASSARNLMPSQSGVIGAATNSRKSVSKTEYVRGLGHLISVDYNLPRSSNMIKAIAIVATVALDNPDIIVSDDDVRKALKW